MKETSERRKLQRELADHLREKDRAALGLLRAKIKSARVDRKHMVHAARQSCRSARASLQQKQAEERRRLTLEHQVERVTERAACSTGKLDAKTKGLELEHSRAALDQALADCRRNIALLEEEQN